jgi:hypothetical protein
VILHTSVSHIKSIFLKYAMCEAKNHTAEAYLALTKIQVSQAVRSQADNGELSPVSCWKSWISILYNSKLQNAPHHSQA